MIIERGGFVMKVNIRDLFDDLNPEEYRDIEIKKIYQ